MQPMMDLSLMQPTIHLDFSVSDCILFLIFLKTILSQTLLYYFYFIYFIITLPSLFITK